jgi:transglutaminase-like putative cysteine protease
MIWAIRWAGLGAVGSGSGSVPEWLRRFMHPREGWLAFVLLLIMLLTLCWSVQRAGWLGHLDSISAIASYGAVAGLLLGLSGLTVVATLPIAAALGTVVVLLNVGGEYFPQLTPIERVMGLRSEALDFTRIVVDGGYPPQLTPYAVGLGLLMWVTAFMAAYTMYRHHRVLDAILVVGAPLIANMAATLVDLFGYLILFVLAALLLWLRTALINREEGWLRRRVKENLEVPGAIMRSGLAFIVVTVALAWIMTTVAVAAPLTNMWNNLDSVWTGVRDGLDSIFSPLDSGESRIGGVSFGRQILVKGNWTSDDTPVLRLVAQKAYYLRAATYDDYTGHGWEQTRPTERRVEAGALIYPDLSPEEPTVGDAFELETVAIEMRAAVGGAIFTPGYPVRVFAPTVAVDLDGRPFLESLHATSGVSAGQGYEVAALISKTTQSQLRAAGTDYPPEVTAYYLGTDRVTERTRELADRITAGLTNPFDKAEALAQYLQGSEFRYENNVGPPDPNRDLVDFFLFDLQRGRMGYCEYYASAMAVMARALKIPARVATGFSPGTLVADNTFEVREENAHAWVELYFPGYGWQPFEATKTKRPVVRPEGEPVASSGPGGSAPVPTRFIDPRLGERGTSVGGAAFTPLPGGYQPGGQPPDQETRGGNALLIVALVLAGLGFAGWRLRRSRRAWRFLAPGDRQWQRLALVADRAGVAQRPSETIYEYAGWLEDQLPRRRPEIRAIADGKVWQSYSGHRMTSDMIARIESAWQRLQWPIIRLALRRRLRSLRPGR